MRSRKDRKTIELNENDIWKMWMKFDTPANVLSQPIISTRTHICLSELHTTQKCAYIYACSLATATYRHTHTRTHHLFYMRALVICFGFAYFSNIIAFICSSLYTEILSLAHLTSVKCTTISMLYCTKDDGKINIDMFVSTEEKKKRKDQKIWRINEFRSTVTVSFFIWLFRNCTRATKSANVYV